MPSLVVKSYEYRGIGRTGRLPIASGQTYKAGDFLAVNSSGQLVAAISSAGSDMSAWTSGQTNLIVGRALEDAQPQTNDPTILPTTKLYGTFIVAEPGTQFRMPVYHPTASSAYPSPTQIGSQYNFSYQTVTGNNVWCVNLNASAAPKLQIVDFVPDYYPGWPDVGQSSAPSSGTLSQYADCWVEFLGGACLLTGARPLTRTN
jgi:hypothetical protein